MHKRYFFVEDSDIEFVANLIESFLDFDLLLLHRHKYLVNIVLVVDNLEVVVDLVLLEFHPEHLQLVDVVHHFSGLSPQVQKLILVYASKLRLRRYSDHLLQDLGRIEAIHQGELLLEFLALTVQVLHDVDLL